jgi:hypothetical protein
VTARRPKAAGSDDGEQQCKLVHWYQLTHGALLRWLSKPAPKRQFGAGKQICALSRMKTGVECPPMACRCHW